MLKLCTIPCASRPFTLPKAGDNLSREVRQWTEALFPPIKRPIHPPSISLGLQIYLKFSGCYAPER